MKYVLYILALVIIISIIATVIHLHKVSIKNKKEMAQYSNKETLKTNLGKTLVIYYSLTNRTKDIALQIQQFTNADIYEIKTIEQIKQNPALYIQSKKQLSTKNYPKITNDFPNIDEYDTIFVGAPVWWYTIATPVLEFLNNFDFKNKNVVPFSTQGSNFGTFFDDFKVKAKNANILKGQSFNNLKENYNNEIKNKIISWLNNI